MRRRDFIKALGAIAATWPVTACRQEDERIRALQLRVLQLQAESAAYKINQFIGEIQGQIGWTTQLPWSAGTLEARRFDGLRLLRQAPDIVELSQLDAAGKQKLCVSRLLGSCDDGADFSQDPKFTEAVANKVYYGPVYFRRESEPYMTLSVAGTRRDAGVTAAEVSLKLLWDAASQVKVGENGYAYVIDAKGRLIAHPDLRLVLRHSDMSKLEHVRAVARGEPVQEGNSFDGRKVMTAFAPIYGPRWVVFVDLPFDEVGR